MGKRLEDLTPAQFKRKLPKELSTFQEMKAKAARDAYILHNGNKRQAAKALNVTRSTFYAWLELAGLHHVHKADN